MVKTSISPMMGSSRMTSSTSSSSSSFYSKVADLQTNGTAQLSALEKIFEDLFGRPRQLSSPHCQWFRTSTTRATCRCGPVFEVVRSGDQRMEEAMAQEGEQATHTLAGRFASLHQLGCMG